MARNIDVLIEELAREQRYRWVLVIAAVVGILASAILGIGFALGHITAPGATGPRNPGALVFFVVPFAVAMVIGGAIYRAMCWYGRRRRRSS